LLNNYPKDIIPDNIKSIRGQGGRGGRACGGIWRRGTSYLKIVNEIKERERERERKRVRNGV